MDFVNNGEVSGVTLLNSNFFHMNMYRRKDMLIKDVTVMAPGDSPNTDGISIGSLGRYKDEKDVTDINVKDSTLKKKIFDVRIKAYEDATSVLTVSKIHYENIKMEDSANPIFIDMKYCPNKLCTANGASKVTVKDVTFKNITDTSSTPEAVSLLCTAKIPCTGVTMDDVNVEYSGTNNKTMAICTNAKGSTKGCLKDLACF
ncbi:Pectin lyase-like superfamily protein [Zea mays]|uniref:Pectin lyase-like superfamily protein n=1 Tax=Zea mays TaxID=4577 RepID=A0A1D6LRJ8_MAIZE|nr:Pectin lyase-like superfamily protein [Zea mays]